MNRKRFSNGGMAAARAIGFALIACGGAWPGAAYAQSGGQYDMTWNTLDAGGGMASTGGIYALGGGVGQPDAGSHAGGVYALTGGFWVSLDIVTAVDAPGNGEQPLGSPVAFRLYPAAPSPFAARCAIHFDLPNASAVDLRVYDASGRAVRTLTEGTRPAGRYEFVWNGDDASGARVASGIYFVRMAAGSWSDTQKLIVTR